ncbi:hypothetical protein AAH994_13500 [Weeksellaceae bacterium A-14]
MKFWSIATLMVFLNFTALPGIAAVFGWDLPQTNVVISEEEQHSSPITVFEKALPKTLNVHDFLKFFETASPQQTFVLKDDGAHLSPLLTIFSPPPEA